MVVKLIINFQIIWDNKLRKITYISNKRNFDRIDPKSNFSEHNLSSVYKTRCLTGKIYVSQTKKKYYT